MALPTMRAGITGREFVRVAGGFGAPALGTSPAGGLDIDNAGNLATDGDITAKSITVENDVQQWNVETRGDDNDKFIIRDATNGQDVIEILPNAGDERMQMTAAETVFNQAGLNVDHRIEGDADANLLFLDAANDRVGIGTNAPIQPLDVNGSAHLRSNLYLGNNGEFRSLIINDRTGGSTPVAAANRIGGLSNAGTKFTLQALNGHVVRVVDDSNNGIEVADGGAVGIGGTAATDVLLDLASTTAAFRPPSMTTTQRDLLTALAGMMIYNTTTNTMQFYNGSTWATI